MVRDISPQATRLWAAQTAAGTVVVGVPGDIALDLTGAELVVLRRAGGATSVARLLGPLAGRHAADDGWRLTGRYRVDPDGEPLSALVDAVEARPVDQQAHGWGALGLPNGLETRVRTTDDPASAGDVALAWASSGHRLGEADWRLTLAPGDRVMSGPVPATVIAVDRRKRSVELDVAGEIRTANLDDLTTGETIA